MQATFLDHKPGSGEYPERSYDPTLKCVWVLFEPESTEAWVGAFGVGGFGRRKVIRCGETPVFLVLAEGNPYLVNGETGDLVSDPFAVDILAALPVPERDLIIGADNSSLFAITSGGLVWESPIIAIGGIDLLEATSDELQGQLWTEDGIYRFSLGYQDWQLTQGEAIEEYSKKQRARSVLPRRRGCLAVAILVLVAVGVLITIPFHGYRFDASAPEILSTPETGIILLPELVFVGRARPARALWCSLLGYWAPAACLFEVRAIGLHVWFLRGSGVEYHALEPFPYHQGEAYVYNGKLHWLLGRDSWEWVDQGFRKLSRSDTTLLLENRHFLIGDVMRAEGWIRHRVDHEDQTFSMGSYSVRYSRPLVEEGPTEITIEDGPVVGKLYSRDHRTRFTGWVEQIPDISVQEQQPTG